MLTTTATPRPDGVVIRRSSEVTEDRCSQMARRRKKIDDPPDSPEGRPNSDTPAVLELKLKNLDAWIGFQEQRLGELKARMDVLRIPAILAGASGQPIAPNALVEWLDQVIHALASFHQGAPSDSLFSVDLDGVRDRLGTGYETNVKQTTDELARLIEGLRSNIPGDQPMNRTASVERVIDVLGQSVQLVLEPARRLRYELIQTLNCAANSESEDCRTRNDPDSIVIQFGDSTISLWRNDGRAFSFDSRTTKFFGLFLQRVHRGVPGEVVPWAQVNGSIGGTSPQIGDDEDEKGSPERTEPVLTDRASATTRSRLQSLRRDLEAALGPPPDSDKWIVTVRNSGLKLNTSVAWEIGDALSKLLKNPRSVHATSSLRYEVADRGTEDD